MLRTAVTLATESTLSLSPPAPLAFTKVVTNDDFHLKVVGLSDVIEKVALILYTYI